MVVCRSCSGRQLPSITHLVVLRLRCIFKFKKLMSFFVAVLLEIYKGSTSDPDWPITLQQVVCLIYVCCSIIYCSCSSIWVAWSHLPWLTWSSPGLIVESSIETYNRGLTSTVGYYCSMSLICACNRQLQFDCWSFLYITEGVHINHRLEKVIHDSENTPVGY